MRCIMNMVYKLYIHKKKLRRTMENSKKNKILALPEYLYFDSPQLSYRYG
jgi:hypothetical protein